MDWRPDGAEKVHQIHGTDISFSSKPDDLDEKAVEALREIRQKGIDDGLEELADAFDMEPQDMHKGFFLSKGASYLSFRSKVDTILHSRKNSEWRAYNLAFGYCIGHHASGYTCLKRTYMYHKDNHKTNWIMVVYKPIHGNAYIKTDDVVLCHLFQSDNYDPRPNLFPKIDLPRIFDFRKEEVSSHMLRLEGLMKNPESFKDSYEFDDMYAKFQANGRNGKRAKIWEHFTEIKVLGPDGEVMLTLAICHHCSMAYLTGRWDPKKRKLTNHGTNTLKDHYHDQHDIAGNPHQIS